MAITVKYATNAALQYNQGTDLTEYIAGLDGRKFLTVAPNPRSLQINEESALYFLTNPSAFTGSAIYRFYDMSWNLLYVYYLPLSPNIHNQIPVNTSDWYVPQGTHKITVQLISGQELFTQNSNFSSGTWVKGNMSVVSNAAIAPDGTLTADKIIPGTSGGLANMYQQIVVTAGVYDFSVMGKPAGYDWIEFAVQDVAGSSIPTARAWFNMATGQIGTVQTGLTASIVQQANGYYKATVTYTPSGAGTIRHYLYSSSVNSVEQGDGNGTSGSYMVNASLRKMGFSDLSEERIFLIDNQCSNEYPFVWLNKLGGMDTWTFTGNQIKDKRVKRNTEIEYSKRDHFTSPNRIYGFRENVSQETFTVFTRVQDKATAEWLKSELIDTIEAWVTVQGQYYPINILDSSVTISNDRERDFNVSIRYSYAFDVNIQTR